MTVFAGEAARAAVAMMAESVLNVRLDMNPDAADQLRGLDGKVIRFEMTTPALVLFFIPLGGRLTVLTAVDREPDVRVRGSALNLAKAMRSLPGSGIHLEIHGDVEVGQSFQHVLRQAEFDWEEFLAPCFGDVVTHRLAETACAVRRRASAVSTSLAVAAGEYLREETDLAVSRNELACFVNEVDCLRDDVDRLEARLTWILRQSE